MQGNKYSDLLEGLNTKSSGGGGRYDDLYLDLLSEEDRKRLQYRYQYANPEEVGPPAEEPVGLSRIAGQSLSGAIEAAPSGVAAAGQAGVANVLEEGRNRSIFDIEPSLLARAIPGGGSVVETAQNLAGNIAGRLTSPETDAALREQSAENLQETLAIRARNAEEAQRLRQQYVDQGGSGVAADIAGALGSSATSFAPLAGAAIVGAVTRNPMAALATQRGLAVLPATQAYADAYAQFKSEYPNAPDSEAHRYAASMATVEFGVEALVPAGGALTGAGARQVAGAIARRTATEAGTEAVTELAGQGIQLGLAPNLAPDSLEDAAYNVGIAAATGGLAGGAISVPTTFAEARGVANEARLQEQKRLAELRAVDEKLAEGAAVAQELPAVAQAERAIAELMSNLPEGGLDLETRRGEASTLLDTTPVIEEPAGPSSPFLPRSERVNLEARQGEASTLLDVPTEVVAEPQGPVSVLPGVRPQEALALDTPRGEASPIEGPEATRMRFEAQRVDAEEQTAFLQNEKQTLLQNPTRENRVRVKEIDRELGRQAIRRAVAVNALSNPPSVQSAPVEPPAPELPLTRQARVSTLEEARSLSQPITQPEATTPAPLPQTAPTAPLTRAERVSQQRTVAEQVLNPVTGQMETVVEAAVSPDDTRRKDVESFFSGATPEQTAAVQQDQANSLTNRAVDPRLEAAAAAIANRTVPPEQRRVTPLRAALGRAKTAWDALAGVRAAVARGENPNIERYDRLIQVLSTEDMKDVEFKLLQPETEATTEAQRRVKEGIGIDKYTKGLHEVDNATGKQSVVITGDGYAGRDGTKSVETTLHEIVHAKTAKAIRDVKEGRETDSRIVKAVNDFEAIRGEVRKADRKDLTRDEAEAIDYATTNTDEFLSGTMTNPLVQSALKKEGFWKRIVNTIRIIVRAPRSQKAVLDEILDSAYAIVDAVNTVNAERGGDTARGLPGTAPNRAFAGPRSQTADLGRLADAERQIAEGADPDQVRKDTGWFKGVDGKWRYEIDDSKMSWKIPFSDIPESKLFQEPIVLKVGDVVDHPDLFAAYPELKEISLIKRAGFMDSGGLQGWFNDDNMEIGLTPYSKEPLSTLLHELQHVVQMKEGFAKGGNESSAFEALTPEERGNVAKDLLAKTLERITSKAGVLDIAKRAKDLLEYKVLLYFNQETARLWKEWKNTPAESPRRSEVHSQWSDANSGAYRAKDALARALIGTDNIGNLPENHPGRVFIQMLAFRAGVKSAEDVSTIVGKEILELNKDRVKIESGSAEGLKDVLKKEGGLFKLYESLAGEVESRNVQKRMNLTAEQRLAMSPRDTQDVPDREQIIIEQSGGGLQASASRPGSGQAGSQVNRSVATPTKPDVAQARKQVLGQDRTVTSRLASKMSPFSKLGIVARKVDHTISRLFFSERGSTRTVEEVMGYKQGVLERVSAEAAPFVNRLRALLRQLPKDKRAEGASDIDRILKGEIELKDSKVLTREMGPSIDQVRKTIDKFTNEIGQEVVRSYGGRDMPKSTLKLLETLKANLGSYVARTYMSDQDKTFASDLWGRYKKGDESAVEVVQPLVNKLSAEIASLPDLLRKAREEAQDLSNQRTTFEPEDTFLGSELRRLYENYIGSSSGRTKEDMLSALTTFSNQAKDITAEAERVTQEIMGVGQAASPLSQYYRGLRSNDQPLRKRSAVPKEIRDVWGEITDPLLNAINTTQRMGALLSGLKASNMLAEMAPESFTERFNADSGQTFQIPNNPLAYGKLAGMYTDEGTFQLVSGQMEMAASLLYGKPLDAGKTGQAVGRFVAEKLAQVTSLQKMMSIVLNPFVAASNVFNVVYMPLVNGNANAALLPKALKIASRMVGSASRLDETDPELLEILEQGIIDPVLTQADTVLQERKQEARTLRKESTALNTLADTKKTFFDTYDTLKETISFLETVPKIWNYLSHKETFKKMYPELGEADIKRLAAEETNRLNLTYARVPDVLRMTETAGISYVAGYMQQVLATSIYSVSSGARQAVEGIRSGNKELAMFGIKKLGGSVAGFTLASYIPQFVAEAMDWIDLSDEEDEDKQALLETLAFTERGMQPMIMGVTPEGVVTHTDVGRLNPYDSMHSVLRALVASSSAVARGDSEQAEANLKSAVENLAGQFAGGSPLGGLLLRTVQGKAPPSAMEADAKQLHDSIVLMGQEVGLPESATSNLVNAAWTFTPAFVRGIARAGQLERTNPEAFADNLVAGATMLRAPVRTHDPFNNLSRVAQFEYKPAVNRDNLREVLLLESDVSREQIERTVGRIIDEEAEAFNNLVQGVRAARYVGRLAKMPESEINNRIREGLEAGGIAKTKARSFVQETTPYEPTIIGGEWGKEAIETYLRGLPSREFRNQRRQQLEQRLALINEVVKEMQPRRTVTTTNTN